MNTINVKFKKTSDLAITPTYGTDQSAGIDLYACFTDEREQASISPHETRNISSGIAAAIPEGYVGLIYARSGMATKRSLAPANKVGVIDSDYRGEIMVPLHNHGSSVELVSHGERIAQLIIVPYWKINFEEVVDLDDTDRGEGGFGSTGQ